MVGPLVIVLIAIFFLAMSGNIIRFADAHPFAIVFYRMIMAAILLLPFHWSRRKELYQKVSLKLWLQVMGMGFFFALHLFAWVSAIQHTKVANAAICLAVQPVFIALAARLFFKEKIDGRVIFGIVLGAIGIILVSYDDLNLSKAYFIGDMLSLLSALLYVVYFFYGRSLRGKIESNLFLMTWVYIFAGLTSIIFVYLVDASIWNYTTITWLALFGLAVMPTILGHALVFLVVKQLKSSTIGTLMLLEPVLAGVVAYIIFAEHMTYMSWLGYLIVVVGMTPMLHREMAK